MFAEMLFAYAAVQGVPPACWSCGWHAENISTKAGVAGE